MTNRQTSGTRAMHDPVTGAIRVERADTVVLVNPGANLARVPMAADAHIALVSRADVVQEGDTLALPPESVAICRTAEPTRS